MPNHVEIYETPIVIVPFECKIFWKNMKDLFQNIQNWTSRVFWSKNPLKIHERPVAVVSFDANYLEIHESPTLFNSSLGAGDRQAMGSFQLGLSETIRHVTEAFAEAKKGNRNPCPHRRHVGDHVVRQDSGKRRQRGRNNLRAPHWLIPGVGAHQSADIATNREAISHSAQFSISRNLIPCRNDLLGSHNNSCNYSLGCNVQKPQITTDEDNETQSCSNFTGVISMDYCYNMPVLRKMLANLLLLRLLILQ